MADDTKTPETTPAPEKRDATTDTPVTEVAQVDATTTKQDAKDISGFTTAKDSSQQQQDAYEGVLQARDIAKGKDVDVVPPELRTGPGAFGL